jgi:hypothetical protein
LIFCITADTQTVSPLTHDGLTGKLEQYRQKVLIAYAIAELSPCFIDEIILLMIDDASSIFNPFPLIKQSTTNTRHSHSMVHELIIELIFKRIIRHR